MSYFAELLFGQMLLLHLILDDPDELVCCYDGSHVRSNDFVHFVLLKPQIFREQFQVPCL